MKTWLFLALTLYFTSFNSFSQDAKSYADVYKTVDSYFMGWKAKDQSLLTWIFHPESTLKYTNREGAYESVAIDQHIKDITDPKASFLPPHVRDISNIVTFHNGASATVTLRFKTFEVTDFFQLLRIGNEWKIVSKVSVSRPLDKEVYDN